MDKIFVQGLEVECVIGVWEWELGRVIGLVFAAGFAWLWFRKRLPRSLRPHLVAMFVLGGMQGLLGWYMVKSGLVDLPHVSQYRLTAHLGLAILIYLYMLWVLFMLLERRSAPAVSRGLHRASIGHEGKGIKGAIDRVMA